MKPVSAGRDAHARLEATFSASPAVSAHIKAMEDTLGLARFERTPREALVAPAPAE